MSFILGSRFKTLVSRAPKFFFPLPHASFSSQQTISNMASSSSDAASNLEEMQKALKAQQELVRRLKEEKAAKDVFDPELAKLKSLRAEVDAKLTEQLAGDISKWNINRPAFEDLLKRRFFVSPSFGIYGGVGGLYDYGPPLCAIKANFLNYWRQHFVLEENMLELDLTNLTPEVVLKTSGHVDRFNDFMVKDLKTGDCYRADKLLKDVLETKMMDPKVEPERRVELARMLSQVDNFGSAELDARFTELAIKAPDTNNDLSPSFPFNLMFGTSIGPAGNIKGYLRPETAQGIFVNFRRLLDYNGGRMPFAGATIGTAFRNEIAPRSGLLRVREFTLAEIEHFVDPEDKSHPKFRTVADLTITAYPRANQDAGTRTVQMKLGDAVREGTINNQTIGYFIGRVHQFLLECGVKPEGLRFRQHLANEMAHYASDCWDAEILTTYGWVECVGIADRACYDLNVHATKSKVEMVAYKMYDEPRIVEAVEMTINKGVLGKVFRKEAGDLMNYLGGLPEETALALQASLDSTGEAKVTLPSGQEFALKPEHVKWAKVTKREVGRNYTPSVVEPSFGVGRILYAILEQSYYSREGDEQRAVLQLSSTIAPYKCAVLPLSGQSEFDPFVAEVASGLSTLNLSYKIDDSSQAIGRRYARTDELGVPFIVTVDFTTVSDRSVTLRERDSCKQIRAPLADIANVVKDLVQKRVSWEEIRRRYPEQQELASELIGKD